MAGQRIDQSVLDEIKSRIPLTGYIQKYVKLERKGALFTGCCPFHTEKSGSFCVYPDHFHCFGCGEHGDLFHFASKIGGRGVSGSSFIDAVKDLAREAGVEIPTTGRPDPEKSERSVRTLACLSAAADFYADALTSEDGSVARQYLVDRGVTGEDIAKFKIGWAPSNGSPLLDKLKSLGFTVDEIIDASLARRRDAGKISDFFFGRVIFPVIDQKGQVRGFGGRLLVESDRAPKYINSSETPVYKKGKAIYGLHAAVSDISKSGEAILVEGNIDVVASHRVGLTNVVAPMGTAITEEQLLVLWKYASDVTILLDGDDAGGRAALKIAERALALVQPGRRLWFSTLAPGHDPDSLVATGDAGVAALKESASRRTPLDQFLFRTIFDTNDLTSADGRATAKAAIYDVISKISDPTMSAEWCRSGFAYIRTEISPPTEGVVAGSFSAKETNVLLGMLLTNPSLIGKYESLLGDLPIPAGSASLRDVMLSWWSGAGSRKLKELRFLIDEAGMLTQADAAAAEAKAVLSYMGTRKTPEQIWTEMVANRMVSRLVTSGVTRRAAQPSSPSAA